jgi:membrane associated rhomboid family serine protease
MRDPRKLRSSRKKKNPNFFNKMSVTNWLILINVAFFFIFFGFLINAQEYCDISINHERCITKYIAVNPQLFFENYYLWTAITNVFMHGGFFHLFINMFVLFSLGNLCERIIGRKRYLWFYLISGIVASLFFVFFAYFLGTSSLGEAIFGSSDAFAVGASGAIFAVAGLFMILTPRLRFAIIFLPFFSLPAYIMIPLVLVATWIVSSSAGIGIGNTAHFGGFVAGVVYGLYLRNKYKRKTKMIEKYFSG